MGKWLAALKQNENNKSGHLQNPQNPPSEGFEGFEGLGLGDAANLSAPKATAGHGILKRPVSGECKNSFPDPEDLHDLYEERAAIMEYDAGMSRADAEAAARADVLANRPGQSGRMAESR
ncbi:MAG: hypothetical protein K5821_10505 [Nitrobacter sp.]|uniref:hypothetical protein n=1 Tax=Nitrobacter sp. TaxID=29420 RepID=UPI00262EF167|nr:hypothetical protein [Nitrobacter sp.]MCV0386854.1 hypothetical protein [Nitrobacter sp.]